MPLLLIRFVAACRRGWGDYTAICDQLRHERARAYIGEQTNADIDRGRPCEAEEPPATWMRH